MTYYADYTRLIREHNYRRYTRGFNIDSMKYYQGFNVPKEQDMYEEELKELELVYRKELVQIAKAIDYSLPALLAEMAEFLKLHQRKEEVDEKLDVLLEKNGRRPSSESCGGEDE